MQWGSPRKLQQVGYILFGSETTKQI